ncbi:hypothetical protein CLIB1444_07S06172 [[Candida] jaroonii]|uniref:Uncharacterized protein n=1 Tax=[Candida] jaroonii TaxID=467808 RepID=A0ACA9YB35_9ASCO|nr:hypothetical protein CLIB1444_07S06172 [[Candida] jaroonii]
MRNVSKSVSKRVLQIFPQDIYVKDDVAKLSVSPGHQLSEDSLKQYMNLIDTTIGNLYYIMDGKHWKIDKLQEMKEIGLVYISYETDKLVCFVSVMVVLDHGIKKLYLYEIHVDPSYQHSKLGTLLMDGVQKLALDLDSCGDENLSCKGVNLTVFSANELSYNWYLKRGFRITDNSPQDRVLRNGTSIKATYYLMARDNEI